TDAVIIDGSTSGLGTVTITGDALGNDLDAEGNTPAQGGSGITDVARSAAVLGAGDGVDNDTDGMTDEIDENNLLSDN
ncbi:hypothetical protein, partial [Roseibium sp. RKSG952]|uniref:hypothetical protein n=1 Tax=Roseibium sp. RKSG952 TaxID=2529384 RepID=UPI0018AD299C